MLTISSQGIPKESALDSVALKTGLLFVGVFLFTFLSFMAYSMFLSSVETYALETTLPAASVVDDIDPNIAKELAKVMEADDVPEGFSAKDPFQDRSGIGKAANDKNPSYTTQLLGAVRSAGGNPSTGPTVTRSTSEPWRTGPGGPDSANRPSEPVLNTRDRYGIWADRAKYGALGEPSPTIFSIEDLVPVGIVDGGTGPKEIMFFSEAAGRIISFSVGTRLYNGWIMDVITEGVIFGTGNKEFPRRLKSWGRSINSTGSQNYSLNNTELLSPGDNPVKRRESVLGGGN